MQSSFPTLIRRLVRFEYRTMTPNIFVKVALWYQKAAQFEGDPAVWDYHVVLLLRPRQESAEYDRTMSWVYDFDTILPVPCPGQGKSYSFK